MKRVVLNRVTSDVRPCVKCQKPIQVFLRNGNLLVSEKYKEYGQTCDDCIPEEIKKELKLKAEQTKSTIKKFLRTN